MRILSCFMSIYLLLIPNIYAGQWDGPTEKKESQMRYFMPTGFAFDAVLKTAILSFNTVSPVMAETEYDIEYLGKVMIPKGTRVIGSCSVEKTIDRCNVLFTTLVFPNGQEIKFAGIALHTDGSGGVPGKVDKQKARLPATILLTGVAAGASVATQSSISSDMIKGFADSTKQELQEKQDYSISIKKDTQIQVYVINRIEY